MQAPEEDGPGFSTHMDRSSGNISVVVVGRKVSDYLDSVKITRDDDDGENYDIRMSRLFLEYVTQMTPKDPLGWIAAARLEEAAGKIQAAQKLIDKGCEECPNSEDVWWDACRLAPQLEAKRVIARGVKAIPNSVKLWIEAAELEQDDLNKSRLLRKGLEHIPDSVRLWKAVVDVSNEEDAKALLHRAVECCPLHLEFWLVLARLESYENAMKVLNKAREKLPDEPAIWIAAAKLEEASGNTSVVGKIIERSIRAFQRKGRDIDREVWLKEAEAAGQGGFVATCQAIIEIIHKVAGRRQDC